MIPLRLGAALVSVCLGVVLCTRRKQPLFFKILLFAAASYLLGALFEGCWELIYGNAPGGFHVGCLGYVGMWFFLFSSYFGAIDRRRADVPPIPPGGAGRAAGCFGADRMEHDELWS